MGYQQLWDTTCWISCLYKALEHKIWFWVCTAAFHYNMEIAYTTQAWAGAPGASKFSRIHSHRVCSWKPPPGVSYNELTKEERVWVWLKGKLSQYIYTSKELLAAILQTPSELSKKCMHVNSRNPSGWLVHGRGDRWPDFQIWFLTMGTWNVGDQETWEWTFQSNYRE